MFSMNEVRSIIVEMIDYRNKIKVMELEEVVRVIIWLWWWFLIIVKGSIDIFV